MTNAPSLEAQKGEQALSALKLREASLLQRMPHLLELASAAADESPAAVMAMSRLLANVCGVLNVRFALSSDAVPTSWVMGATALLPCVAVAAEDAAHRLFGISLGVSLRPSEQALFGVRAAVPPVTGNLADIVRALFFMRSAQVLFGLRRDADIDVAEVVATFRPYFKQILDRVEPQEGELPWLPQSRLG